MTPLPVPACQAGLWGTSSFLAVAPTHSLAPPPPLFPVATGGWWCNHGPPTGQSGPLSREGPLHSPRPAPVATLVPSVGSQVPGARHLGGPLPLPLRHHRAGSPRGPSVLGPSTVAPFHQREWEPLSGGLGQARSRLLVAGPELLTQGLREPSAGVGTWFPARGARQHSPSSRGSRRGLCRSLSDFPRPSVTPSSQRRMASNSADGPWDIQPAPCLRCT